MNYYICLLVLFCNLSVTHYCSATIPANSIIQMNEIEQELEANPATSAENALQLFQSKGGTIHRMEGEQIPFKLLPNDVVFPSCSGGNNRSQTLWNLLRPYSSKITILQPHATQYGFDPYNGQANWLRIKSSNKKEEFSLWAGVHKSKKLGWDLFADFIDRPSATAEELQMMTEFYNREYYKYPVAAGVRRVYITFAKNVHVHLVRLNQTNESLENVVLLFYPLEDLIKHPLPEWDTYHGSVKTYEELAKLIVKYLDFSEVSN